jgi:alcohol dehydrogenase (NADP+)
MRLGLTAIQGPTLYPCCVGHEIAGTAVKVGKNVKHFKVGDRVGVGAQSSSCLDCEECADGKEQYCSKGNVGTYNGKYTDGSKSFGGYADYCRAPAHFAVKIPDSISTAEAAPMLCGGVTVWSPLIHNGAGPGKRVGIVGVGGLGHFGLLWAKALGCDEVVAISRTNTKKEDALKMGATKFIATEEEGWNKKNARSLDLIVSTVSSPNMPLSKYFQLLRTNGQFIQVGSILVPELPKLTCPFRSERQKTSFQLSVPLHSSQKDANLEEAPSARQLILPICWNLQQNTISIL